MKAHRKRIGDLFIATGLLIAFFGGVLIVVNLMSGPAPGPILEAYGGVLLGGLVGVVGLGIALSGFSFQRDLEGSRPAMMVSAGLVSFAFPIGTVLGLYAYWYLFGELKDTLKLHEADTETAAEPSE